MKVKPDVCAIYRLCGKVLPKVTMKLQSVVSFFALLALFVIYPTSAHATAVLSFTGSTVGGTITETGVGSGPVTQFTSVPYNSLFVAGANIASANGLHTVTNGALNFNTATHVLTLTGEISGLAGLTSTPTTLVTIDLTGGLIGTTNAGETAFNLTLPNNVSSVTESSTLLADLGLTGDTSSLNGLGVVGQGNPNGSGTYEAISDTMGIGLNAPGVPEPVSYALTAAGLVVLACFRRKLFSAIK